MITPADAAAFLEQVNSARDVLIGTHLNPDGDALGSALAIAHYLHDRGIAFEFVCNNPVPYNLEFLPGKEWLKLEPERKGHDLGIVLDLDNFDRLGRTRPYFEALERVVLIDHHVPHTAPGSVRIVYPGTPATALLVTQLFGELGVTMTPAIAQCLLTGIVTDTGGFRFRNTTPESLHLAANLLVAGGNIVEVTEEVYARQPLHSLELYGRALSRMHVECEGKLIWTSLREEDFREFGAAEVHTEGFASQLLTVDSAQIVIVLRQPEGKIVRASIRSRKGYDVSEVARKFGGGGHPNASGCTFPDSLEEAETLLVEEARRCLGC